MSSKQDAAKGLFKKGGKDRTALVDEIDNDYSKEKTSQDTLVAPDDDEIVRISVDVRKSIRKAVKLYVVNNNDTVGALVERLLMRELKEHGALPKHLDV